MAERKEADKVVQGANLRLGKTTFIDAAYQHLLEGIVSHRIKPGTALRAKELAPLLGISPTPIERALERLAGEGLVEFRPGHGPFVAEPTVAEVIELYDVRLMLETYAVQQGIERAGPSFLAEMDCLIEQHREANATMDGSYGSLRVITEADKALHLHLLDLWPNSKARTWYSQINVHIRSCQLTSAAGVYRATSVEEHRAILRALERKDVAAVTAALRQHTEASKAVFLARAREMGFSEQLSDAQL